jgi:hypothetical protein
MLTRNKIAHFAFSMRCREPNMRFSAMKGRHGGAHLP